MDTARKREHGGGRWCERNAAGSARLQNRLDDVETRALSLWVVTGDPIKILKASENVEDLRRDEIQLCTAEMVGQRNACIGNLLGLVGHGEVAEKRVKSLILRVVVRSVTGNKGSRYTLAAPT